MNRDPFQKYKKDLLKVSAGMAGVAGISFIDLLAHQILNEAKRKAPVRTGALRASGRVMNLGTHSRRVEFGGGQSGVMYAAAVEFGRFSPTGRQRGSVTMPQPYLRPAMVKVLGGARKELKKVLQVEYKKFKKSYSGSI
tara:strand:+ start:3968 stop:4384 length:417 start_codon:yes stop_codon:yes gene_type:complete